MGILRATFLILALTASAALAAEGVTEHTLGDPAGAAPAAGSVEDFAWLAGRWVGEGFGGTMEEVWLPAANGVMLGAFRSVGDDGPRFYEILTIADRGEGLSMRLKHFHPDLTGWEEKEAFVEFRWVGKIGGVLHFEGIAFRRDGPDAMTIWLAVRQKGEQREHEFRMKRVSLP